MNEELKAQLDELKKGLEGKTTLEVKTAIEAFEAKVSETIDAKAKELFDKEIETVKADFVKQIAVVQDHADKLDLRLQKKGGKMEEPNKPFGEVLAKELTEKTDELEKFARKETKSLVIELKAVGDISTGNVTGGSRYGELFNPNIIDGVSRNTHIEDILPGGSIGPGNSFTFMREAGVGEGNPAPVAEGATKPQFDFDLEESTVNIETIAGWLRVTRKAMSNIPGFISFLQRRIPQRFMNVKDAQFLYGNGTTPNIKGLLTAGNFIAQGAAALPLTEKIINYISLLEDTYERDANGILLRPSDYYSMFTQKASGSGEYDLPFGVTLDGGQARILGIPVFTSTALTAGDIVVGDWSNGAQILTQEAMRIEFFEQDGDNVRTNKVTVRVEGNYALPVYGPDYFIKGTTAQS